MTAAFRCDRCQQLRDGSAALEVRLAQHPGGSALFGRYWQICEPCVRELGSWFGALDPPDAIEAGEPSDTDPAP